jgi:hypothetical protein
MIAPWPISFADSRRSASWRQHRRFAVEVWAAFAPDNIWDAIVLVKVTAAAALAVSATVKSNHTRQYWKQERQQLASRKPSEPMRELATAWA